jgi:hypothetical protein
MLNSGSWRNLRVEEFVCGNCGCEDLAAVRRSIGLRPCLDPPVNVQRGAATSVLQRQEPGVAPEERRTVDRENPLAKRDRVDDRSLRGPLARPCIRDLLSPIVPLITNSLPG